MGLRKSLPMLRWSVVRTGLGIRKFNTTGQLGDGRESAAADYVVAHARDGDIDDVIAFVAVIRKTNIDAAKFVVTQ